MIETKRNINDYSGNPAYPAGMLLLLTLGIDYVLGVLMFWFGISMQAWLLPCSFLLASAIIYFHSETRAWLRANVISVVIWVVAVAVQSQLSDLTVDGLGYHLEIQQSLVDGWNPIYQHEEEWKFDCLPWTPHYCIAFEMLCGSVAKLTGIIESGRAIGMIMMAMTLLLVAGSVGKLLSVSKVQALIIGLLVALNPVWTYQFMVLYIDYAMYFYLVLTLLFTISIWQGVNVRLSYMALIVMVILSIATKFNSFFMEGLAIASLIVAMLVYGKKGMALRYFTVAAVAGILGTVVFAFHPYITNIISDGHPFYPLMGEGAIDIMTEPTPEKLAGCNRFVAFAKSITSIVLYDSAMSALGGYGYLFLPLLVLSLGVVTAYIKDKEMRGAIAVAIWVTASCFLFEQAWWARYNPQLWLIVAVAYYLLCRNKKSIAVITRRVIAGTGFLNIFLLMWLSIADNVRETAYLQSIYSTNSGRTLDGINLPSNVRKLFAEHNVGLKDVDGEIDIDEYTGPKIRILGFILLPSEEDYKRIMAHYENSDGKRFADRSFDLTAGMHQGIKRIATLNFRGDEKDSDI